MFVIKHIHYYLSALLVVHVLHYLGVDEIIFKPMHYTWEKLPFFDFFKIACNSVANEVLNSSACTKTNFST